MRIRYTLKFYANKYTEKNGKCTIYGRIIHKQKKNEFATQLTIKPSEWNKEFMQPYNNPFIKRELSKIENDIQNTVSRLEYEQIHIDSKSIKDYYTGKDKVDMGILEYLDRIIELKKKTTTSSNHNKYMVLKINIGDFIRQKHKVKDFNMKKINLKLITDFDAYLKSIKSKQYDKPLELDTIAGKHSYFRYVLRQALNEDYIRKTPYDIFKIKKGIPKIKRLTASEIIKIEELQLKTKKEENVRDIFLFSVFTGLRFTQSKTLTMESITAENGEYKRIFIYEQMKNKTLLDIPLLERAKGLIEKYEQSDARILSNFVLPPVSNSYFNKVIKKITKSCNIPFKMTHHVARHTYATTILMENDVGIYEVKDWLGHSSINSTKIYAKITSRKMNNTASRLNNIYNSAA